MYINLLNFNWLSLSQEKRIYDLKKKNQELEKFKFVLDYKIKELRKQMEPRENEIKSKKEQISKASDTIINTFTCTSYLSLPDRWRLS